MKTRMMLAVALTASISLGGCAGLLSAIGGDGATSGKTMEDVEAAKGNFQVLSDTCLGKDGTKNIKVLDAACLAATDALKEKGDVATLTEICEGQKRESPYWSWRQRDAACKAKGLAMAGAAGKGLDTATCETIEGFWKANYKALTDEHSLGDEAAKANFVKGGKKLAECGKWDYVIEQMAHWGQNDKGMGYHLIEAMGTSGTDWEKQVIAYADRKGSQVFTFEHANYFLSHLVDYLVNHEKMNCKPYIAIAEKTPDAAFGPFNWYFRKTMCDEAAEIISKRLTSDSHKLRGGACTSLGLLGTKKKHLKKLSLLAKKDAYYWLKEKDSEGRTLIPPVKVYDVRTQCAEAANKLELK